MIRSLAEECHYAGVYIAGRAGRMSGEDIAVYLEQTFRPLLLEKISTSGVYTEPSQSEREEAASRAQKQCGLRMENGKIVWQP